MALRRLLIVLLAVLFTATAAGQERTRVALSGTVVDPSGAVIPNARVSAMLNCHCSDCPPGDDCKCCPGAMSVSTNEAGEFQVSVVPGSYTITVSGANIETTSVQATVSAEEVNHLTITVKARGGRAY